MDFESMIMEPIKKSHSTRKNVPRENENDILANEIDTSSGKDENVDFVGGDVQNKSDIIEDLKIANTSEEERQFHKDVIKLAQLGNKSVNGRCAGFRKYGLIAKLNKCGRKYNYDSSFIAIMTNMLNKYAKSEYKFTDEMTEMLLEKILGKNTDLRHSIFDVDKLLHYLRYAIHRQREPRNDRVVKLKSKHCLSLSLPGCFCKPGFVENFGQCVKPSDCVDETLYASYLARIVVL